VEVVASLSQVRTAAAQCGLFTHKSVPVISEPPCTYYDGKLLPHVPAPQHWNTGWNENKRNAN